MKRVWILLAIAALATAPVVAGSPVPNVGSLVLLRGQATDGADLITAPPNTGRTSIPFGFTSLEAEGSFGLFQNVNDYAFSNPADAAVIGADISTRHFSRPSNPGDDENARTIFTNLTNFTDTSGSDRNAFSVGGVGKVGPGNLFGGFAFDLGESTQTAAASGSTPLSFNSESQIADFFIGYGFGISDKINLGFSLRSRTREDTETGTDDFLSPGTIINDSDEYQATQFNAAVRWDVSESFAWNVAVRYDNLTPEASAVSVTGSTTETSAFEQSSDQIGFTGRVNWYWDKTDLELYVGAQTGDFSVDTALAQVNGMNTTVWSGDDIKTQSYQLGARYMRRFDTNTDFAAQLGYDFAEWDGSVVRDTSPATPTTNTLEELVTENSRIIVPVSIRQWFFDQELAIIVGAIWTYNQFDDTAMATNFNAATSSFQSFATEDTFSDTDYRFATVWRPNQHFSAQFLLARESESFDTSFLRGSPSNGDISFEGDSLAVAGAQRQTVETDIVAISANITW